MNDADRSSRQADHRFEFSGGALCLDFANTLTDRPRAITEHLSSYRRFLSWGCQAGILDSRAERDLLEKAGDRPEEAERILKEAVEFREALYRIFSSQASGLEPEVPDLELLNRRLPQALPHLHLQYGRGGWDWLWVGLNRHLDSVLWAVARSAAELLTSGELQRVGECAAEDCSWLFLDRSRARQRRWCDMKACGNRAKARRYYRRHRG